MATAEAALQKCFIKLHTAVSQIHDVKKLLLQNPNKKEAFVWKEDGWTVDQKLQFLFLLIFKWQSFIIFILANEIITLI